MAPDLLVRRARSHDTAVISRLNNTFADHGQMLQLTTTWLCRMDLVSCSLVER